MNKEQLFYFVKVIDCGSMNKAAEELFVSQPSLSRAIQAIEHEIGKELILRSNKGINITPAGKVMYYYAQSIIGQFQMIDRLKEVPNEELYSNLSISVSNIFLRDELILDFYDKISASDTEINFFETTIEEVLNNVINRKSEIGIIVMNTLQFEVFHKMCELKGIDTDILGRGPLYIHANKNVFPESNKMINAAQLLDKTYVHSPYDFYGHLNLSIAINNIRIDSFKKTITTSNYHAQIKMIQNHYAFLLGHKWQIEELEETNIQSYLLEDSTVEKLFVIIRNKKEYTSNAAKIFIKLLKDYYQNM